MKVYNQICGIFVAISFVCLTVIFLDHSAITAEKALLPVKQVITTRKDTFSTTLDSGDFYHSQLALVSNLNCSDRKKFHDSRTKIISVSWNACPKISLKGWCWLVAMSTIIAVCIHMDEIGSQLFLFFSSKKSDQSGEN